MLQKHSNRLLNASSRHERTFWSYAVPMCLVMAVLLLGVSGCSKTLKKPQSKPTKLVSLADNRMPISHVFSQNIGSGDKKDPLRLQAYQFDGGYVAASRSGGVEVLDANGKTLWRKQLEADITSGVSGKGNTFVVSDAKGVVHAFDLSGKLKWQNQLTGLVLAPALVTTDMVVVSANNGLITGIDQTTGKTRWTFSTNIPAFSLRGSAAPVALSEHIAVVADGGGRIHALRTDSGVPLWSRRVSLGSGVSEFDRLNDTDADPVFYDFNLYTASFQSHVVGIDMNTRQELFQIKQSSTKTLGVDVQNIYLASTSGELIAYNRMTGQLVWQNDNFKNRRLSNPVAVGGFVLVGDYDGYIHSVDAATGKEVGRARTSGGILQLSEQGGDIFTITDKGVLSVWRIAGA